MGEKSIMCKRCNSLMVKIKKTKKNMNLEILAILIFLIGFILLFFIPVGTLFGIILIITSTRIACHEIINIQKCLSCGYFFEIEE